MNIFITASNELYRDVCNYNCYCAKRYGEFDKVVVYDVDKEIDETYRQHHANILSVKRGAGLWLWKVYFIDKALKEECSEGDILFYADAASFFFRSVKPVLAQIKGDFFAVNVPYIEEEFTKKEAFDIMGLHGNKYTKSRQFHASFMAFRKTKRTLEFVTEWKKACEDIRLLSSDACTDVQIEQFIAHRNDQSIFSLLCKKYGVQPSQDPSQYGITGYGKFNGATLLPLPMTKAYPFCLMLHKQQKWNMIVKIKCWLRIYKRFLIRAI